VLDVTVLPIVELWKEAAEHDQLPSDGEVAGVLAHVGPARWSLAGTTVTREPGVRFDLNAVAEGAMADAALALLREAGCVRAIVELGGDVALHRAPGQPPFRIGVDDPGDPSRLLARLEVHAGAIDTAGDYQRFHTIRGRRYGHIVDPRTARPLDPELSSVTVLAPDALTADAWDTALFALGWQGAQDAIEAHPELEALLVHHDGRVWISKGLEGKVSLVPSDQKR
jgi:thiamine biosynthesis lipoprotein